MTCHMSKLQLGASIDIVFDVVLCSESVKGQFSWE